MNRKYYTMPRHRLEYVDLEHAWRQWLELSLLEKNARVQVVERTEENRIILPYSQFHRLDFDNEKPVRTIICRNPYIKMEEYTFLVNEYLISENIRKHILNTWLNHLKLDVINTNLNFAITGKNGELEFALNEAIIIALLSQHQIDTYKNYNIEFDEWDIKLNDTV